MALDFNRPNALGFDGVSSYLTTASAALTAVPVTLAAWIYVDKGSADPQLSTILQLKNSASAANRNCYELEISSYVSGGYNLQASTGAATNVSSAVGPYRFAHRTWMHCAGVFVSDSSRQAFMNAMPGAVQTTTRIPSGINSTSIGASLDSSAAATFFVGALAHAAIWNVALATSDISRLARGVLPALGWRIAVRARLHAGVRVDCDWASRCCAGAIHSVTAVFAAIRSGRCRCGQADALLRDAAAAGRLDARLSAPIDSITVQSYRAIH